MNDVITLHPAMNGAAALFEGQPVDGSSARLTSTTGLEIEGRHQIDDLVHLALVGQVTGVAHVVDPRGQLVRVHTIKIIEVEEVPGA